MSGSHAARTLLGIGLMLLVVAEGVAGIGVGIYLFGESDAETFAVILVMVALLCWGGLALRAQTVPQALVLVVAAPVTTTVAMSAPRAWGVVGFAVLMVFGGFWALRLAERARLSRWGSSRRRR